MEESLKMMRGIIDGQIKKLDELRARVAILDENSSFFTKDAYLQVLDAYIECEKRHHENYGRLADIMLR